MEPQGRARCWSAARRMRAITYEIPSSSPGQAKTHSYLARQSHPASVAWAPFSPEDTTVNLLRAALRSGQCESPQGDHPPPPRTGDPPGEGIPRGWLGPTSPTVHEVGPIAILGEVPQGRTRCGLEVRIRAVTAGDSRSISSSPVADGDLASPHSSGGSGPRAWAV